MRPAVLPGGPPAPVRVLGVADVTARIRELLEGASDLADVWVRGEVSNFRRAPSGHCYFDLKAEGALLPCVLWKFDARRLAFEPTDGIGALARGDVKVYEAGGRVQLVVRELRAEGEGASAAALEALRRRLDAEGLFAESRKRALPALPVRVGLVTSRTGAVVHDVATTLARRAPSVTLLLRSVRVQGEEAPREIADGIAAMNSLPPPRRPQVLIVGRGGGSAEDLAAFHSEIVVRAIVASEIPVVSAVGHESDFTLADFAADARAATPTAAAEIVTASLVEAEGALEDHRERLAASLVSRLDRARDRLDALLARGPLARPDVAFAEARQRADELSAVLHSLSPLATLARGYAVARRGDGRVLASAADARAGDEIAVVLRDGEIDATVTRIRPKETNP